MKTKNKELKKFTDEELLAEIIYRSKSKKGLPIKAMCFKCHQGFWIKWNNATQSHSKLSNWEYWIGKKSRNKICNSCLRAIRDERSEYLEFDIKKKRILSAYLNSNRI
ncbi:hypothetical protein [endosymbiont GvMRE of Glomus versiforme]|uniref:hypothetical protein n=1 Tax=endosymbiont GvMRE of Glomus versiforme TaxID=2039283 RepID=UPI000EE1CFD0|nr:hypothetical protein [endosymbiont GvMRE of Glomus versiforme]RHZ36274.1 hypothetical protein GvMRE_Ic1g18 [endosymbiont GvMRE of Glomus versiforme]